MEYLESPEYRINTLRAIKHVERTIKHLQLYKARLQKSINEPYCTEQWGDGHPLIEQAILAIDKKRFTLTEVKEQLPADADYSDRMIGSYILSMGYKKRQMSIRGRRVWMYI